MIKAELKPQKRKRRWMSNYQLTRRNKLFGWFEENSATNPSLPSDLRNDENSYKKREDQG